ncbi:MAG TPA: adenosylcobinamide-GDP ribazoletransferase [Actinomycetota bacterium]|jgi:adenosylcobinamide-GDP ribazoletransferase
MSGLVAAVSLLTRVPVEGPLDDHSLARAIPWFPVVGLGIGSVIAGAYAGLVALLPPFPAAAVAVIAGALLTGAFHEDGLGDVADAFAGGWTKERRLEILDDPRLGAFGVLAVSGAFVVRVGTLSALGAWEALALVPAAHALSRAAAIELMRRLPPAAPGRLGATYAARLTRSGESVAVITALAAGAALIGAWAGPATVLCGAGVLTMGALARAKIGGMTGDVLGATQQICEICVLLMGAAVVHEGWGSLAWWA